MSGKHTRNKFKWICICLVVCVAGAAAYVYYCGSPLDRYCAGIIRSDKPEVVDINVLDPGAATTVLPEGAVEVCSGGIRTGLFFTTKQEAELFLTDYLKSGMEADYGDERAVEAVFSENITLADASGARAEATNYSTAMKLVQDDQSVIPITVTTEKRTYDVGEIQTETQKSDLLPKGSSLILQMGTGGKTMTLTKSVYTGGSLSGRTSADPAVQFSPLTERISKGTFVSKHPDEEPEKKEGKKPRAIPGFSLILPVRAKILSYFGIRNGRMHNGIDIPAKSGTEIHAPGGGIISYAGERGEYGFVIDIDHENGCLSRLTGCTDVQVELNQRVFQGDLLASASGAKTEEEKPHLHYELLVDGIPVNPLFYLD